MSIIKVNYSNNATVADPAFYTEYLNKMKTTDAQRQEYLNIGYLQPPSTEIKIDKDINKNMLLQYALQSPKEYLKKRSQYIEKTKDEVNRLFIDFYKDLSTTMIESEAREASINAVNKYYGLKMEILEMMYPKSFSDKAFSNELKKQLYQNQLDMNTNPE